jgi:hypothetical protein
LELRGHEVVARSGAGEDGEVNLEPEEVEDEGHDDQPKGTRRKVLPKVGQAQGAARSLYIQKIPEIDAHGRANGDEGEETDVLDGYVAGQGKAGKDQPLPPLPRKGVVAELVEPDVAQETAGHGEDERRVEQDEPCLANVRVVEQDKGRGDNASGKAVAGLPHDQVDDGDGHGAQEGGHRPECDIGDLVRDVRVADVLEVEVAIVTDEPASEGEEQLAEGRVHVEEVRLLQVVRCELERAVWSAPVTTA